jgi:carbon storage regulator
MRRDTMLVLTRKLGEKILIGEDIVISIERINRGQVKLGIVAPAEVKVYREEILPGRQQGTLEVLALA